MTEQVHPPAPDVPFDTWRELLASARAFRAAAPWSWMGDSNVFALIDEEGRPWFSSVLGAGGQVFGLVLYRGEQGLRFLFDFIWAGSEGEMPPRARFAQDALMLDWGTKRALQPEDLAVLATLGHRPRPREKHAWPCFRSHSPGWVPWFLESDEARSLSRGTQAALVCAELARRDLEFFVPCIEDFRTLPTVSIADALAGRLTSRRVEWRQWQLSPPATPPAPAVPPGWAQLRARPQNPDGGLEFDIIHHPEPVAGSGRPFFPRLALVVDAGSGYICAMEMADPECTWAELVATTWKKALATAKSRPAHIAIRRAEWFEPLQPIAEALEARLVLQDDLPFIDEARKSLAAFSGR